MRSPVPGWVLKKPPPPSPAVFISQVRVLIIVRPDAGAVEEVSKAHPPRTARALTGGPD